MMHFLVGIVVLAAPAVLGDAVARVDGEPVTAAQVSERAAASRAAGSRQAAAQAVEDLINEAVLAGDGLRAGLDREPRVIAAGRDAARRAAAALFLEAAGDAVAPPTDAQLRDIFHAAADSVRLHEIRLATRAEAEAALGRLAAGARFADEAKRSLDPQASARSGDVGLVVRGQLEPKLAEAAFSAPLGVASGPVQLELGWAVISVGERNLGDEAAFARRRVEIARYAAVQQRAALRHHLLEQLRKQEKVALDDGFLRDTGTRLDGSPAELEHVVASVGGQPVRYRDVLERVRGLAGRREGGHFTGPSVKTELAWAVVDDLLLADAAVARGLDRAPAAAAARRRAEREAMVRLAAERLRAAVAPATPDEVRAYYRANLTRFLRPARRDCSHILVGSQAQAEALRGQLARGASWDDLAAEHSLDPASAGRGGLIGSLDDRQLAALATSEPALAAAVRGARPGVVAGPVKSRAGWHLVRADRVEPATVLAPEQVAKEIAARLLAERQEQAVRARIAALRASAAIDIDPAAVRRLDEQLAPRKEPTP